MTYDWSKMVKMTVPVGLCGWQQRGSLTINGRTTEFPVGVETELPEPVAERVKAMMADAEEKAEHVQPLKPWMQYVTGADGVARWEERLAYAETEEAEILQATAMTRVAEATFLLTEPLAKPLAPGMICTVTYNGEEYECPVVTAQDDDGEKNALGNIGADTGGEDTGEPFIFVEFSPEQASAEGAYAMLAAIDGAESVTISITGVVEKVKPIDADKMGKNAGANKVLVTDENGEAAWSDSMAGEAGGGGGGIIYVNELSGDKENPSANPCFSDRELTKQMDYATGKAILLSGGWVCTPTDIDGLAFDMYLKPISMYAVDDVKAAQVVLANPNTGEDFVQYHMGLVFSDSEA